MRSSEEIKKGLEYCSEKAKRKTNCSECIYFNDPRGWCSTAITRDALAYIQQLETRMEAFLDEALTYIQKLKEQQPRWISVGERLPEEDQEVLLIAHGWEPQSMYIGHLRHVEAETSWLTGITSKESEWSISGWSYLRAPEVTHWMPLPQPPEEGN